MNPDYTVLRSIAGSLLIKEALGKQVFGTLKEALEPSCHQEVNSLGYWKM